MSLREINLRCQQLENELDELNLGEDDLEQREAIIKQLAVRNLSVNLRTLLSQSLFSASINVDTQYFCRRN